jgi:hydrogenase expression/formation protein HypD
VKHLDEYRDPVLADKLVRAIQWTVTRPWTVMEVCGGQTHTVVRNGLDRLLPDGVRLVHGPGCPVCVTPLEQIDRALAVARRPGVIFTSFGDMLRVPGSTTDLLRVRAEGGDVRTVYSPLDAVRLAQQHPDSQVVFFAVGFETTAPVTAVAVRHARRLGLDNFSLLVSHVLVPPAMKAILSSPANRVQGFLAAGHVCAVMGYEQYVGLAAKYRVPIVVTGFEPVDLLEGLWMLLGRLELGRAGVENQYARAVQRSGNREAQLAVAEVYEVCDRPWRGLGVIPQSGLRLRDAYRDMHAEHRFDVGNLHTVEDPACRSGEVLQGLRRPDECPAFGTRCTPETPLGAPMVSAEGACAAYWKYGRRAS